MNEQNREAQADIRRSVEERRRNVLHAAAGLWADRRDLAQLAGARRTLDRDLNATIKPARSRETKRGR